MISTFDTDANFWSLHPDMKVIRPFKDIYDDDKSKKKEDSSKMMWFIVLCYDRDSKLFKQSISEKHRIVGEDFIGDAKYYSKWKIVLDAAISAYTDLQYTPMQKVMNSWNQKLQQRAKWIDGMTYEEDFERLDKAMVETKKVYDAYKVIMDDMHKEDNSGMAKGGATPSLLD